ncbi:MAG: AMP-binding protein [Pseudomonadota bacterium]
MELSAVQRQLLTGARLAAANPRYNMAFRFDFRGPLDVERLRAAFAQVTTANVALHARIDGEQLLAGNAAALALEHVDGGELDALLTARASRPLPIEERLFEATLYACAPEHHVLYLNQHHLITDGAAFAALVAQLADAYAGGVPAAAPSPDHRVVDAARLERAQAFWAQRVQNLEPVSTLGDNPTERYSIVLDAELMAALRACAQDPELRALSRDLTNFSLLAATLLLLRARLFAVQDNGALGVPFHNRTAPGALTPQLEIGCLEIDAATSTSFVELVRLVQRDTLLAMKNIVPGVGSAEINNRFSWLLNYLPDRLPTFEGVERETTWLHCGAGDPTHALRLQVEDFDGRDALALHFDCSTAAFTAQQAARLPSLFVELLRACVAQPGTDWRAHRLGSALSAAAPWQDGGARVTNYPCVSTLLANQAAAYPDAAAVVSGVLHVTYAQLSARVAALVPKLQRLECIPILLDRSIDALVLVYGALAARVPFVPLDIEHPQERINGILGQLGEPPVFVAAPEHHSGLASRAVLTLRDLETDADVPESRPPVIDAAYLIFTSGSTGEPKGVAVGRQSLSNYVGWATTHYRPAASTDEATAAIDMPLFSSLAFDLTLTSMLLPVATGGSVRVYSAADAAADALEQARNTSGLAVIDVLRDDAVDVVKLTPSHLRLGLAALPATIGETSRRVHTLILGGEDLPRSLALEAQRVLGAGVRICNEYGPTEATIGCMIHDFDAGHDLASSVPIGRPIANARVELVDAAGQTVPPGFDGDMVLSGVPLALGYLGADGIQGTRYDAGDRARLQDDGTLLYLGRRGRQVKFRGARIELAEIERVLLRLEGVDAAHVRLHQQPEVEREQHCAECGISTRTPRIRLDATGVCGVCRDFAAKRERMAPYFRTLDQLSVELRERADARGVDTRDAADCLILVSGGKDSSYALCRLRELGFNPVVFTLDNGYLSQHALDNVERMTRRLSLRWVRARADGMDEIFADSLRRHSNVCNGCFKTIYTLAVNYAVEHNIPSIVTGLSRGQLFETRLLDMVDAQVFDPADIDRRVRSARLAYHRVDDAVSKHLDVSCVRATETFERVAFFDFYRYTDVPLADMLRFLHDYGDWRRPPDTGRSTNCLINDVGIHVHKTERGFHNYAVPYAWDVRIGHKTRAECIDELNDDIDLIRVREILDDIDYRVLEPQQQEEQQLIAYVVPAAGGGFSVGVAREQLRSVLPHYALPTRTFVLSELPLTSAGKVDERALPAFERGHGEFVAPQGELEVRLAAELAAVLGIERVGRHDDFFELGGDSIAAVQFSVACRDREISVDPIDLFEQPSIAALAAAVLALGGAAAGAADVDASSAPDIGLPDDELDELFSGSFGGTGGAAPHG